jgi:hypothetical protein
MSIAVTSLPAAEPDPHGTGGAPRLAPGVEPAPEVAARLLAAAGTLGSFSSDELDRLLLDGPPFAETVAQAARRTGNDWDEHRFRTQLDDTLARRDLKLIVLVRNEEPGVSEFMRQLGLGCQNAQLAAVAI